MEDYQDVWIVGDSFLKEVSPSHYAMRYATKKKNKPPPYLFDHFNVRSYYLEYGSSIRGIARSLHPLVAALNENDRLPKYLLVVPDNDLLISMQNKDIKSSMILGSMLHYIIRQMDMYLDRR